MKVQKAEASSRKRLRPHERAEIILDRAIGYFAEFGFNAGTRDLAHRIGVSQPLLYKYYPSKDELIYLVYKRVYLSKWNDDWTLAITDRRTPLSERLVEFYTKYTQAIFNEEWLRIYLHSGLTAQPINSWYIQVVEEKILRNIVIEFRAENAVSSLAVSAADLEIAWVLQGGIFYYGIRKYIYKSRVFENLPEVIHNAVGVYISGMQKSVFAPKTRSR